VRFFLLFTASLGLFGTDEPIMSLTGTYTFKIAGLATVLSLHSMTQIKASVHVTDAMVVIFLFYMKGMI
jgi:hypothetical protein